MPMRQFRTDFIMDAGVGMAATVAPDMPKPAEIAANHWRSETELTVETAAFGCTALQNGRSYAHRLSVMA